MVTRRPGRNAQSRLAGQASACGADFPPISELRRERAGSSRADRDAWKRHVAALAIASGVVLVACALEVREPDRVAFRWAPQRPLPHLCLSRVLLQHECPACGLTRSFSYLAAGDWARSFRAHCCGWLLALVVVLQIPYRLWALVRLRRNRLAG